MNKPRLEDFGLTIEKYNHVKYIKNKSPEQSIVGFKLVAIIAALIWLFGVVKFLLDSDGSLSEIGTILLLGLLSILFMVIPAIMICGLFTQLIYDSIRHVLYKVGALKHKESKPDDEVNYKKFLLYEEKLAEYEAYQKKEMKKKTDYWYGLSGRGFEKELGQLYRELGYKVTFTPATNDGGIDIILEKKPRKIIVQCKAHKKKLGPSTARELYGVLSNSDADSAILATLEGVSSNANKFLTDKPINVLTVKDIISMQEELDADI